VPGDPVHDARQYGCQEVARGVEGLDVPAPASPKLLRHVDQDDEGGQRRSGIERSRHYHEREGGVVGLVVTALNRKDVEQCAGGRYQEKGDG